MDMGDERQGLRLPGVRTDNTDGSFDVEYDVPLAIYDCRLDDGVTLHQDIHDGHGRVPGGAQPGHAPGVVGQDVLQALPQPRVRRRHLHRQRHGLPRDGGEAPQVPFPLPRRLGLPHLRVQADELDAGTRSPRRPWATRPRSCRGSTASPTASSACSSPRSPRTAGCCRSRSPRDSFELWPAKRREFIVDFTRYQDGSPDHEGRRHLPHQRDEDARRPDVGQLVALRAGPGRTRSRC